MVTYLSCAVSAFPTVNCARAFEVRADDLPVGSFCFYARNAERTSGVRLNGESGFTRRGDRICVSVSCRKAKCACAGAWPGEKTKAKGDKIR